ncbi:Uncharacterised protein [Sphingobacterium daejeonense]|nr:Uncharacterised protein [Sphingobacterium daejeonense]
MRYEICDIKIDFIGFSIVVLLNEEMDLEKDCFNLFAKSVRI